MGNNEDMRTFAGWRYDPPDLEVWKQRLRGGGSMWREKEEGECGTCHQKMRGVGGQWW